MNRSRSDTATAPPRKRHVTRARARVSRARHLSHDRRSYFTLKGGCLTASPRHIRSAAAAAAVVAAAPAAAGRGVRAVAAAAAQQAAVAAEAAQQNQENQPAANAVIAVTSHD